jgi:hypothetical protein
MASKFTRLKISKFSGVARLNLVIFALLFAGVGVLLVSKSLAGPSANGPMLVNVYNADTNGLIQTSITVTTVQVGTDTSYYCTDTNHFTINSAVTFSGKAYFSCGTYTASPTNGGGKSYNASASGGGYIAASGGPIVVKLDGTTATINLYLAPDNDNDGIRNISDDCVNIAGVSANKGCPNGNITGLSGPGSVAANTSFNMTWGGSYISNCSVSPKPGAINTSGAFTVTGGIAATTTFTITCSQSQNANAGGVTGSGSQAQVTVTGSGGGGGSVDASIVSFTAPASVAYPNTVTLSAQASAQSCTINGAAVTVFVSNEVWSLQSGPNNTNPTVYTLSCVGSGGGKTATSTRSVTVTGVPGGGNCTSNCGGTVDPPPKAGGTNGRTATRTGGVATTGSDKTKPTAPTNFQAEQFGSGEVDLSWDASTDNIAVEAYELERSTDQTEWTKLDDAISDTSYTDSTADYATTYTYRLSAKDTAGNFSDYALIDITTNDFEANVFADQESTISSDDGLVEISIPAGALSEDSFCEISKDSTRVSPKGYKLASGPYSISCRNKAADSVTSFDKAAKVTMHLKSFKKFKKFKAYAVDGNNLSPIESSFNKNTGDLTFSLSELQTFAAYGAKGSNWWLWILFPLLLIGLVLLILRIRNSRGGSDDYYDTTNYVAMPPSAPVAPTDAVVGGYQHHPSLPEMVAQNPQPQAGYPAPPLVPGQQAPQYPPDTDPNQQ